MSTGLRSPEVRSGLGLIGRTLLGYRKVSAAAIAGALLWMGALVAIPYLIGSIIDDAISAGDRTRIAPLVGWLVAAGLVQGIGIGVRRYFGFKLSYRAETDLRNRMFEHLQRLAFNFHDQTSTGQLMARASSDLSQVRLVFAMLPITIANIGMLIIVVTVLIVIDPVLGVVASLAVPTLFASANRFAGKVIQVSFRVQERLADLSEVVEEAVGGIQVVKAYGQEDQEAARLETTATEIYDESMTLVRLRSQFAPLFELIPSMAIVSVLWLGGIRVVDGDLTIGEFVAFTQYLTVLVFPLRITGWFFAQLPRAGAAATRIQVLLAEAPEITSSAHPRRLPEGNGEVHFAAAGFSYPGGPPVLNGVDLVIPAGTSAALVGATGSGKTTLAHLIPRFYDATSGSVLLDGVDVRDVPLDDLRREVALVFQETFLFSASVRENIAFGNPAATDDQVRLAARLAQAHGFICELPEAYDTVVGERGYSLSGGQRQRVALARAVLRDPRVLVLDDATSSVDAIVEAEMLAALEHVMEGRTTIIIAHRTSTLSLVDRVVFLDEGEIVAVGAHEELLRTVPRYAEVLAQEEVLS
ncbi:MAG: ABC transporter ATP-binding protein [Acidimicrobiia bacterium]|nr:ABC transporter ATP-binding protein [Acidimicrobiia bacterium]